MAKKGSSKTQQEKYKSQFLITEQNLAKKGKTNKKKNRNKNYASIVKR